MGQHKHNPVAIAAAQGKLPPKKKRPGKREQDRQLRALVLGKLAEKGIPVSLIWR